ncbi:hypothetical protein MKX01_042300 [Papaver californicum]|nr:hypothetical protein MKX01_042300 [Papaver californicum]
MNQPQDDCSIGETGLEIGLTCNTSFNPPKPFTGNIEIIDISESEVRTKNVLTTLCYNEWMETGKSFTLSYTKNMFFAIGCDTYGSISGDLKNTNYKSSCSSDCENRQSIQDESCFGNGCCQITIQKELTKFEVSVSTLRNVSDVFMASFNPCSHAFLEEQDRYTFNSLDILDGKNFISKEKNLPIVLHWAIGNKTCEEAQKLENFSCHENSYCINPDNHPGYRGTCNDGYEGNPYFSPGCQGM